PGSAEALRAHHAAMMGFYSAGEMQNSWASAQKALEQNPQDALAKSFTSMLEAARDNFWDGTFPQKMSWYGFNTANEFVNEVRSRGAGMQGTAGGPDCVLTYTGRQICWKSVPDWIGRQNTLLGNGTRALLLYTENNANPVPSIGVTIDFLPNNIATAIEYAHVIADGFGQQEGVIIHGPKRIQIRGHEASLIRLEMPQGMRSAWYQFLFDRQIVSFQLMSTADSYETDFSILKNLVENLEVGLPMKAGALLSSPVNK
ncbi:MAG: hypothetical protein K8I00_05140, partial [Candidatus Omnitrophica bacterium]|nr:hypothetical protein [Candidatus Omnitrophota bacterium]